MEENIAMWDEHDKSLLHNLPNELLYEIFTHIEVRNLKSCRLVSTLWNSILMDYNIFPKKICVLYRHDRLSLWERFKRKFSTEKPSKSYMVGNHLRISNFLRYEWGCLRYLKKWLNNTNTDQFTCLELVSSFFDLADIVEIIPKFKYLTEIRLHFLYVYYQRFREVRMDFGIVMVEDKRNVLLNECPLLKILDVRVRYSWRIHNELKKLLHNLAMICSNLETIKLEILDTGHSHFDELGHYNDYFDIVCIFLTRNSTTLKEFTLSTYDVEEAKIYLEMIRQNSEMPRMPNHVLFNKFLDQLKNYDFSQTEFRNLRKCSFKFRLVIPDEERHTLFDTTFLPLIKKMVKLNQFELSQIYSTTTDDEIIDKFTQNLPINCRAVVQKLFNVRPAVEIVTDFRTLAIELSRLYRVRRFFQDVPRNPNFPRDLEEGILRYYDSTFRLETNLVCFNILYAKAKSFDEIQFLNTNLNTITKIQIQQCGVHKRERIKIGDQDLQMICKNARELTHLQLEYCNLLELTDYGLTGISPSACERMKETMDYNLQEGELTGHSLSDLKNLRVVKLSYVRGNITDISGFHAFRNHVKLGKLELIGHSMTAEGLRALNCYS